MSSCRRSREVAPVGINPIEYHAWKGVRSAQDARVYVIARSVFKHKLKSIGVILLLVFGFILLHVSQLIFTAAMPHEVLEAETMNAYMGGGGTMFIFAVLLAAVVTSDLISEDRASRSFVLYFSRAVKVRDYLAGKAGATLLVMSLLCLVPPVIIAAAAMATQTGDDYAESAKVLGMTIVAGAIATVFFVPYGLMISSLTERKSYAAVGTFMSFFVLIIIAELFSSFDPAWNIVSPGNMLSYSFSWIYGSGVPDYVDGWILACLMAAFVALPIAVVYLRLKRQVAGG